MWKIVFAVLFNLITFFSICNAENYVAVDSTNVGIMYVDIDATKAFKKDGVSFLAITAEERYTDEMFLSVIRQDEDLKDAIGTIYLYLFDNKGSSYRVMAEYVIDSQGKVLLDRGQQLASISTRDDKVMLKVYTKALEAFENKNKIKSSFVLRK